MLYEYICITDIIKQLDEAEQQEKLLERSRKELQRRKKKEAALKEQLKEKEVRVIMST